MQKNIVNKGLVFAVIVLFISVAVQPGISTSGLYVAKITNKEGTSDNLPPNRPKIKGPSGRPPGIYEYTFNATDPNEDDVRYVIDWGDGKEDVTGFYASNEEVKLNHTFLKIHIYLVSVQAIDSYEYKSERGYLPVSIFISKHIINFDTIKNNDELNGRIKQLSDLPCDCENDNNPLWYPKILCTFLLIIYIYASYCYLFYRLGKKLANICLTIMHLINCPY